MVEMFAADPIDIGSPPTVCFAGRRPVFIVIQQPTCVR